MRTLRSKFLLAPAALAACWLLAGSIAVFWRLNLSCIGCSIIESRPPGHADLILVLGGDFLGARVVKAAQLSQQGCAPLVLISSPPYENRPEGDFAIAFLTRRGYPARLFAVFPHYARSTIDEAIALRPELARRHVKHIILVTSAYHSHRAATVFRLFCPEFEFVPVAASDEQYDPFQWWPNPRYRRLFFSEWSKTIATAFFVYPKYRLATLLHPGSR